uniref:Uncharacterized protein n=1 Tax=Panagrolaimus sp. ES5 TaxID=591445 RepID=A0AC34F2C5_9BILA
MDSSDSESTSSTSSALSLTVNSSLIFPSKAEFLKTYLRQAFSLPDSIMHYMAMNPPSAEVYQKLIQSCKYFFVKNSILVLPSYYEINGWGTMVNGELKDIDLSNNPSKLWITDTFNLIKSDNTIASSIISKIYQCNVKNLQLHCQIITYDEFLILAPAVEHLSFAGVVVKYDDGTIVLFEKLVEQLPKVKKICLFLAGSEMITSKTIKELLKIPHFTTLDSFSLYTIPEVFDIESYYVHIKKNKCTKICLQFCYGISEEYKTRLEAIVDEIIGANNREYKTPYITFGGLNFAKILKLNALCLEQ